MHRPDGRLRARGAGHQGLRLAELERLGCRGAGAEEIKTYKWFSGFNWGECESGEMTAPHADLCTEALEIAEKTASNCMPEEAGSYTSEEDWYAGFGSFLAPGK